MMCSLLLPLLLEVSQEDDEDKFNEDEKNDEASEVAMMEEDDEDVLEKDMEKFENLNDMENSDFPAFMTIRNLIMLVDSSLKYPFFKRNKEGKVRGQTVQNTWHNEQKGTLYINNYHKLANEELT